MPANPPFANPLPVPPFAPDIVYRSKDERQLWRFTMHRCGKWNRERSLESLEARKVGFAQLTADTVFTVMGGADVFDDTPHEYAYLLDWFAEHCDPTPVPVIDIILPREVAYA